MADRSAIEWTDATVNFWWGCTKVGPGCDHCYAETWAKRLGKSLWGYDAPRLQIKGAAATLARLDRAHERFFAEHRRRRRVFMQSMSDIFDNEVEDHWRWDAFRKIEAAANLDIQLLTKRISNVFKMVPDLWRHGQWPRHVGLMITVVNQVEANRDVPRLLYLKKHFDIPWVGLSIEPMLGAIDLTRLVHAESVFNALTGAVDFIVDGSKHARGAGYHRTVPTNEVMPTLDWVIVGGESGHNARPLQADWVRQIRRQCEASATPWLFKQWGEYVPTSDANGPYMMKATSKKIAGRELDGRTHDQFWRAAA